VRGCGIYVDSGDELCICSAMLFVRFMILGHLTLQRRIESVIIGSLKVLSCMYSRMRHREVEDRNGIPTCCLDTGELTRCIGIKTERI